MSSRVSRRSMVGKFLAAAAALLAGKTRAAPAVGREPVRRPMNAGADESPLSGTKYVYDGDGRLIEMTDAICRNTTYTYDFFSYDACGRATEASG